MSGHSGQLTGQSGHNRELHRKAVYSGKFDSHGFFL
jgi:hypothetical protein